MRSVVLSIVLVSFALAGASAQSATHLVASIGLAGQSDAKLTRGVQPSPVGPTASIGVRHATSAGLEVGLNAAVSFYWQLSGDRTTLAAGAASRSDPDGSLTFGTFTAEIGTDGTRRLVWFGCAGAAVSLSSPRPGKQAVPLACAGLGWRPIFRGRLRASYQQFLGSLGETRFQIPIVVSFPLS